MEQGEIDVEVLLGQQLLSGSMCHLAYLGPEGSPRVIPVGCFWTGSQLVVSTAPASPKVAALRARPDVAVTIEAGGSPGEARSLSIRGTASIEVVEGLTEEYVANAHRSMDRDAAEAFVQASRAMYARMARIAITPHWVRFYDFGAGRLPGFMQELAAGVQAT